MSDFEFWKIKYAAVNAAKAKEKEEKKKKKAELNYVEPEDQSHLRDCDGRPLDNTKYSMIRGEDCWYVWDVYKKRWRKSPLIR